MTHITVTDGSRCDNCFVRFYTRHIFCFLKLECVLCYVLNREEPITVLSFSHQF